MFRHCNVPKTIFTALALTGVALLIGCGGLMQSPLSPRQPAVVQQMSEEGSSSDSPFLLTFSDPSRPRLRATKPTEAKSAKGKFTPWRDGRLEVQFDRNRGEDGVRVSKTTFSASRGSIKQEVEISMTVFSGAALEDIGVKFTPSGLKFHPSARLEINLQGGNKKDLQGLKAYHIDESGKVTEVSVKITGNNGSLTLTIEIPGFSMYSIGDELIPQGGGP